MKHFYDAKQININKIYHFKIRERNIKQMEELKLFKVKIIAEYEAMTRTKIVCAKTKEEAQQIFDAWTYYEKQNHKINYIVLDIRVLKRSKRNEDYYNRYLDEDYYKKCLEILERFNKEYDKIKESL